MHPDSERVDARLYRQGHLVTALSRWICLALGVLALIVLWDSPRVRRVPALITGIAYATFTVGAFLSMRQRRDRPRLKRSLDLVDALAIGLGASFSGGLDSPIWLFLYPHVAAVAARRGLVYASLVGCLDATILLLLVHATPGHPMGSLHALALLACAVMGGTTSSYLHQIQARLALANQELSIRQTQVRAHADRLAAINDTASAVSASLTAEDILAAAAEQTRRIVPHDRFTVALVSGESVDLVTVGSAIARRQAPFPPSAIDWALRRPSVWRHGERAPAPSEIRGLLSDPNLLSTATVPLASKDKRLGSLNLGRLQDPPFTEADLAVLEPIARHVAIALDNARLIEAVQRRGREFQSLLEIGRGILERLELPELLPLVTRSVNELMGTHYCILLLRSGDELEVGAQEGLEPEVVQSLQGIRVGESLSGWVAQHAEPLALVEMIEDPRLLYREQVERFGYRSYLCVPLRRGMEVLGTLEVVTKQPRRFRLEDQQLMSAFAEQAAVAIDHARLFRQTRTNLARIEEANRRLEELDRLRQQYLRNVSHEFRTPLTVIRGYAEYLRDTEPPSATGLKHVMRVVVESSDRVIDLVDTLLETSRVEQEMVGDTMRVQELSLEDLIVQAVERLQPMAEKKGISLRFELIDSALTLEGDRGLLQQVVRKLLDNALKYSPSGSQVTVRGKGEGQALSLEVEDTGIGISPEHISRIFDKFYMVDGGIARQVGGTGVGLYLVREIVKLHNGTVEVSSQPGKGSLFSVRLPRAFQGSRTKVVPA